MQIGAFPTLPAPQAAGPRSDYLTGIIRCVEWYNYPAEEGAALAGFPNSMVQAK